MSNPAGTTREDIRFETALSELAVIDVLELLKAKSKRGPRRSAWKLPETMLAAAVFCRIDPTCTFEQMLERVPGIREEMELRSVSPRAIQNFLADAATAYADLRTDHAAQLRKAYENLMPGVNEKTVREMGARAMRLAGITKLATLDPNESKPLDLYSAVAAISAAAEAELAQAKAGYATAKTEQVRAKIEQEISAVRARIASDPKDEYTTEDLDNVVQDVARQIGEEFRKLAEGGDE